jgi:hypothetical protein
MIFLPSKPPLLLAVLFVTFIQSSNTIVLEIKCYIPWETCPKFEEYHLLGYSTVQSVECQPTFRRNISPLSSGSKNKPSKISAQKHIASRALLKMEAICSSETSVDLQRTTRRYIPDDSTLHNHRCKNLKSCILNLGGKVARVPPGLCKMSNTLWPAKFLMS